MQELLTVDNLVILLIGTLVIQATLLTILIYSLVRILTAIRSILEQVEHGTNALVQVGSVLSERVETHGLKGLFMHAPSR